MRNITMNDVCTAVAVIIVSVVLLLTPQLIHTCCQLAEVDWQNVVVSSITIDVFVYLGFAYANRSNNSNRNN